jgi:hypothetical protein
MNQVLISGLAGTMEKGEQERRKLIKVSQITHFLLGTLCHIERNLPQNSPLGERRTGSRTIKPPSCHTHSLLCPNSYARKSP